jgi:uncharacterized repeat protein (TIGR01451 family)
VSDLSISKSDDPDPVLAGAPLTYTLSVGNAGPDTATSVSVTDILPGGVAFQSATGAGWSCSQSSGIVSCTRGSLATGPAPAITIVVNAPAGGGSIENTASVSSFNRDPNTANNTATATTTVRVPADLSITKTDSPDPVDASAPLTYTLAVTNAGPGPASAVTVTDTLPAGVAFVSASGTGWSCSRSGSVVTCTRASLGTGAAPCDHDRRDHPERRRADRQHGLRDLLDARHEPRQQQRHRNDDRPAAHPDGRSLRVDLGQSRIPRTAARR